MIALLSILLTITGLQEVSPDSISLQYSYRQAYENYPISKNIELQKKITDLNVRIANTGYFPAININGKASYQSEVTEFPIPGGGAPGISKDQYEASVGITQSIFNGGAVGIRKELERAKGKQEIHSTEVELHQIRAQIDQVYYGILLSQQQSKTIGLLIKDLIERIKTVRSQVENGVLLPSQQHILEAELINARQDSADIQANIRAGYLVLSELTGEEIETGTALALPEVKADYQFLQPRRPEYDLFRSTRETLEQQRKLAETRKLPSLSAFGTAAYGRPGLNFLNDEFHDYYLVGLRLSWNFWDFLNSDRERQALQMQQQKVSQNQHAFTRQLNATLDRLSEQMASIRENIKRDREIIQLREQIVKETASQLENGVITATEYITELTRASRARLSLFTNQVRLRQAQTDYATTLGISINN